MTIFEGVVAADSCINCDNFEINIVPVNNSYYETELEICCDFELVMWNKDLTPMANSDAKTTPDKMKCSRWKRR